MRIPKRRSEELRKTNEHHDPFLTPGAMERMREEIARLLRERPVVIEDMQEAATQGDFSENAGYQAAKWRLRRLNDRVTMLEERLKHAVVIEAGAADGVIRIGSTVTVQLDGKTQTFTILGTLEVNPDRGCISHHSPIGSALLGHRVGDTVTVHLGNRIATYVIISVTSHT